MDLSGGNRCGGGTWRGMHGPPQTGSLLSFQLQMRKQIQWESDNWCCREILHTWQIDAVWWACALWTEYYFTHPPTLWQPWPFLLVCLSHKRIYLHSLPFILWHMRCPPLCINTVVFFLKSKRIFADGCWVAVLLYSQKGWGESLAPPLNWQIPDPLTV